MSYFSFHVHPWDGLVKQNGIWMTLSTESMEMVYLQYEYVGERRDHASGWKFYGKHHRHVVDRQYGFSCDQLDCSDFWKLCRKPKF